MISTSILYHTSVHLYRCIFLYPKMRDVATN